MLEHGIAITIAHVNSLADIEQGMGVITSSIEYADSSIRWLGSVPDMDNGGSLNWIRSGTLEDASNDELSDYKEGANFIDPDEAYEKIVNRTWAPFRMIASGTDYPGPNNDAFLKASSLDSLSSILVVYTADKSKWSRCVVLEMGDDYQVNEGLARKWDVRAGQSIDKDGNPSTPGSGKSSNPNDPNYMAETGMGWFPGYVINLESGERLNVMYGEDSWLIGENGRDMIFNPTSNFYGPLGQTYFGGKHALFVVGHSTKDGNVGSYDGGKFIQDVLTTGSPGDKVKFFRQVMYTSIPMATNEEWLNNEVKITINVEKPYSKYSWGSTASSNPVNNEWPAYKFNTNDIATQTGVADVANEALDLITVVPNPYQAFSSYEESQLDNRVKVVNLPERCTVKIYNSAGTLVQHDF